MATNETPATIKPGYYTNIKRNTVWWIPPAGHGRVFILWMPYGDNTEAESYCRAGDERTNVADCECPVTYIQARAILGKFYPATWPQCDAPATGQGGHTPDPWYRKGYESATHQIIPRTVDPDSDPCALLELADYDRAVACVNACAGMADPAATIRELRGALERISRSHDCGCRPCTGQCLSPTALEITVDTMRDIATTALRAAGGGE